MASANQNQIVVRTLETADRGRWDAFVHTHPQATFFHLAAWQEIIENVFRHRTWYLYAERAAEIVAILPLAEIRSRLFGHSLGSLPFCVYGGVIGEEPAALALEARADALAIELGVGYLEYRNVTPRHAEWPRQDLYARFRKTLLPEEDDNLQAIPRKQRAMVRKGIKNGLRSEVDQDIERFFSLYADNMRRHGTPAMPKKLFSQLRSRFDRDCEVLTVTDAGGRPLSSVMTFYFRDEVLPYYAGDTRDARQLAANDFKYWELMRRALVRGCRIFDYGRSKADTGSWSFKKNWGFEPEPLAYEYRLYKRDSVPQNSPLNPKYRIFIRLWQQLPLPVANALGPLIVRNLG